MNLEPLHEHFIAEKKSGYLLVALFCVLVILSICLLLCKSMLHAMVVPLLLFGTLQLISGSIAIYRAEGQKAQLIVELAHHPENTLKRELLRMTKVMQHFKWTKLFEGLTIVVSLNMMLLVNNVFVQSVALGVLLQSILMLSLDAFAELRADAYLDWLSKLVGCEERGVHYKDCADV